MLYWRTVDSKVWHCFRTQAKSGLVSLCGAQRLERSFGAAVGRPALDCRCYPCNAAEMKLRNWSVPGAPSKKQYEG